MALDDVAQLLGFGIDDPDAVQARLAKAGFDVSEVRVGRKPGTKIFTVRSGVPGAPTVMLSAEPATEEAPAADGDAA